MAENREGYISSLSDFLAQFHPNLKFFKAADKDEVEVWLPQNPARLFAEVAVDAAWEINR